MRTDVSEMTSDVLQVTPPGVSVGNYTIIATHCSRTYRVLINQLHHFGHRYMNISEVRIRHGKPLKAGLCTVNRTETSFVEFVMFFLR